MDSGDLSPSWMNGFKVGDMVWGKVKSHPWWPGHIFNEEFASPAVRRTKRDNHVLVAFYGDSSYGWFDPSELIPFEPHFPDKSRQTISRTFAKAVEEAVDEASRRGALGISCSCRSPHSVRPTPVPNYFAVDVAGFEPSGIYSAEQIKNSKESFAPDETVFFVRNLALAPRKDEECRSVDWIKRMAAVLAYRRAVYEEFDETYAQAFGVQPVRPSQNDSVVPDHPMRATLLSGPLRVAEALGNKKTSSSSISTKSLSSSKNKKKNNYVLKRRDESQTSTPPLPDFRRLDNSLPNTSPAADCLFAPAPSLPPPPQASHAISALPDATLPAATSVPSTKTDSYVLQKRPPADKPQPMQEDIAELPLQSVTPDAQPMLTDMFSQQQQQPLVQKEQPDSGDTMLMKLDPAIGASDTTNVFILDEKPPTSYVKDDGSQPKLEAPSVPIDPAAAGAAPVDQKLAVKAQAEEVKPVLDGVMDREKVRKRIHLNDTGDVNKKKKKRINGTIIDLSETRNDGGDVKKKTTKKMKRLDETIINLSETPKDGNTGDAKMKKKKKRRDELMTDRSETPKDGREPPRRLGAEFSQTELKMKRPELQRAVLPPKLNFDSAEHDLPQILNDLLSLAMDPFHGSKRNAPDIARHVFLRFRSKVYQKSLVLLSDNDEAPATVTRVTKPADRSLLDIATGKDLSEQKEQKPPKSAIKPDDPAKAGRKRAPSDRQEELIAQRRNTLKRIKAMAEEKKTGIVSQKAPERDPKNVAMAAREPVKKQEPTPAPVPAPRKHSPTYLQLKFPLGSSLPSIATLKAKLARFGQLEVSCTRVFWKSYTCRVLFVYKADAEAACNYGKSNDLFGQVKVNYHLKEVDLPVTEEEPPSNPGKGRPESFLDDSGPKFIPRNGNDSPMYPPPPPALMPHQQQHNHNVKPSLKKPVDDGSVKKSSKQKVRFTDPPVSSSRENGGGGVDVVPDYAVPELEQASKNHNYADFGPQPPVPQQFNPLSHPFHSQPPPTMFGRFPLSTTAPVPASQSFIHRYPPPLLPTPPPALPMSLAPPLPPTSMPPQMSHPLPPPPLYENCVPALFSEALPPHPRVPCSGAEAQRGRKSGKADISRQMLGLLLRCSSIVTNVKSMAGYVPYSPL